MNPKTNAQIYLAFSLLAATLLIILIRLTSSQNSTPSTQGIVFTAFTASCLLGITKTVKPGFLRHRQATSNEIINETRRRPLRGHHPDCTTFQTHTIMIGRKTWCSGCLGLTIGIIASLSMLAVIFLDSFSLSPSLPWLLLGLLLILLVYIETLRNHTNPVLHLVINSLLVPGFALVTVTTVQHTGELIFGLFAILLCILWTDTRMQLAYWRHHTACTTCSEPCKNYT